MNRNLRKIHTAWKQVRDYQKRLGDKAVGGTFARYRDFKNAIISEVLGKNADNMTKYGIEKAFRKMELTKEDIKDIKWSLKYKTRLKTVEKEWEKYSELVGEEKLKESKLTKFKLGKMSTRDFADLIKEDIKKRYKELVKNGKDSYEAKKEISSFYFGS